MALDTENMNVYKVETDNDIYNVVRNYDINKLFDKLIVPNATKEQLKDNLKKALNEKNNDEALRILNYLLKYKHNYYKRNDILLDDESPSSQEKAITLKDAGLYEVIFEGASAKSPWYSTINSDFEHFLVEGSPWTDNITFSLNDIERSLASQRVLYLAKNFNYLLTSLNDDGMYDIYIGNYELNEKGAFLFKKYSASLSEDNFKNILNTFNNFKSKTYANIEASINNIISTYNFQKDESNDLLDYFEYNSSAFAAYGTRSIFLEVFKTELNSKINKEHKVYLRGSNSDAALADIKNNIIFDEVSNWIHDNDHKTYEQKHYYTQFKQTKNLSPTGESAYLSQIIQLDSNSDISYLLGSFDDSSDSSFKNKSSGESITIQKPKSKDISQALFDRNFAINKGDKKYVGLIYGFDYDKVNLNASLNGFIGGGKKGYGPHMNHQDNCYWCNGEDAHIKIRYLGDSDAIMKRVFFPNDTHKAGKRVSLVGNKSSIKGFNYIDVPSNAILEFKYKCSSSIKSLNFDKCFTTVLRNSSSVYNDSYSTYGYESELDSRSVKVDDLLYKLNKTEDILFKGVRENEISLSDIYNAIGKQKWTMSELFLNNSHLIDNSEQFLDFKIDKDWNYYTISFKVFDNMILDFGSTSDEVDYYNNVILEDLDCDCNEFKSQKEYFNKSNVHNENDFIKEITFKSELQDRIFDDNLNTLYNKNYYGTVSFDSDQSKNNDIITVINNTERDMAVKMDIFHDYKLFCEQFEKIYITIKAGNQIDLKHVNLNVDFGDYEKDKTGIINNFYFKRTFFSEEQLYSKRISVKQGEFIYFKCVFNTCRVEIDRELSSMPSDTKVYPVNYDPFENKYYSINPDDYSSSPNSKYQGYEKGPEGTTFQWIRFTTSNSSYDLIIFLKKITVEINFLNDLFGQDLVTKNFSNNNFEPNESFSFFVKLPKECRISNYRYSDNAVYSYIEGDKINFPKYFSEEAYESLISFYSGNSEVVLINYEDYIYGLNNILGSYSGTRKVYELFKNIFSSINKKVNYFTDDTVIFSLEAKYANSHIRISEDYIVGSRIFENFAGNYSNRLLNNGFYRIVGTSGNTGKGGKGGEITPQKIYCTLVSGSGGGGLYGGNSGQADQNTMISPIDFTHSLITFHFKLSVEFGLEIPMPWWVPNIRWSWKIWSWESGTEQFPDPTVGWWDGKKGTIGFTLYCGVGSGTGGQGFYKEGATAGDGSWFVGVLKDVIPEESEPISPAYFNSDPDWPLNKVFNKLDSKDKEEQGKYFKGCFGSVTMGAERPIPLGSYYLKNYYNERYRGVFFDAILNINSNNKNNKIHLFSKVGSSGQDGINGSNSSMKLTGELETLPKDGICGQEGRPTTFELDNNSIYNIVRSSYFTNIKDNAIGIGIDNISLNKCIMCGGVHDVAPQKSLKLYDGFKYGPNNTPIHDQLVDYINDTHLPEHRMTKDEWQDYKVDSFHWESRYGSYYTYPKKESIFGTFAYIFYQWFWLNFKITFQLIIGMLKSPIEFEFLDGFKYLKKCKTYDAINMGVKYRPKFLPLVWNEKTHVIYTVSDSSSGLSMNDVKDDNFTDYSPTLSLELDNNSHFQVEYPFSFEPTHYVSEDILNDLFNTNDDGSQIDSSIAKLYGDRYTVDFKTKLFNYFECYKNFKNNKSIWDDDNNVYKKSTLCVSNVGLTKNVNGDGRLLSFEYNDFTPTDSAPSTAQFKTNSISIMENINYLCSFVAGTQFYEVPINGTDSSIVSTFRTIFKNNNLEIYDSYLKDCTNATINSVSYSSESFISQTPSKSAADTLEIKYIPKSSKVLFKSNDSFVAIYKISPTSKKNTYTISSCNSFNTSKFIMEILDLNANEYGKVVYNSYKQLNSTVTVDIKNLQILTSYSNLIIKNGKDYYVIVYDNNNSLYGVISKNKIQAPKGIDERTYLNYFLEYPTSRGRAPLLESAFLEATFLGRDPSTLHKDDRDKTRIAYIYSGFIYQNSSKIYKQSDTEETNISYNSLSAIDENYNYVALIDYRHLCSGQSILNANSTDWLKI